MKFFKYSGSGNDFILFDIRTNKVKLTPSKVVKWCRRREGIGADGVILFGTSDDYDFSLRIHNSDGSEAEMCGNAARCVVHYAYHQARLGEKTEFSFETMNGVYQGFVLGDQIRIKMTELYDVDSINVTDLSRKNALYLNTGVPHTVLEVGSVEDVNVDSLGRVIRNDVRFPSGTNVDFFEVVDADKQVIKLRVYERGVEEETLCCGTGIMATAVTCAKKLGWQGEITIHAKGGLMKAIVDAELKDLYFQGKVEQVYQGEITDV